MAERPRNVWALPSVRLTLGNEMMRWRFPLVLGASLFLAACEAGTANPETAAAEADVPVFTGTPAEHSTLLRECLRERGWEIKLGNQSEGEGTFEVVVPPDQERVFAMDSADCRDQIGRFPAPTREDLEGTYEWLLGQRRCLVNAGFDIAEPPTLEWWLENYNNQETGGWDPVGDVGHGLDYQRALAACPRSTESWPEP